MRITNSEYKIDLLRLKKVRYFLCWQQCCSCEDHLIREHIYKFITVSGIDKYICEDCFKYKGIDYVLYRAGLTNAYNDPYALI